METMVFRKNQEKAPIGVKGGLSDLLAAVGALTPVGITNLDGPVISDAEKTTVEEVGGGFGSGLDGLEETLEGLVSQWKDFAISKSIEMVFGRNQEKTPAASKGGFSELLVAVGASASSEIPDLGLAASGGGAKPAASGGGTKSAGPVVGNGSGGGPEGLEESLDGDQRDWRNPWKEKVSELGARDEEDGASRKKKRPASNSVEESNSSAGVGDSPDPIMG